MNNPSKTTSRKVNDFVADHADLILLGFFVIGTVQVVSIKRSNKALLKAFKYVAVNHDNNMVEMQNIISSLRHSKIPHTFYPGVGVFVDKTPAL